MDSVAIVEVMTMMTTVIIRRFRSLFTLHLQYVLNPCHTELVYFLVVVFCSLSLFTTYLFYEIFVFIRH